MNKLNCIEYDAPAYRNENVFLFLRIKAFIQATRIGGYDNATAGSLYAPVMRRQIDTFFAPHSGINHNAPATTVRHIVGKCEPVKTPETFSTPKFIPISNICIQSIPEIKLSRCANAIENYHN